MYTEEQLNAIHCAQEILQQAGLQPTDILDNDAFSNPSFLLSTTFINYISPKARLFTSGEIAEKKNQLTRKSYVHGIVDHPIGAILEFPETGNQNDIAIAHRFRLNSQNFVNPKDNIQYSLGGTHLVHSNVRCLLLFDKNTGEPVQCKQTKMSCRSIKKCTFNHSGRQQSPAAMSLGLDATGEVFMKTLGFFCALKEYGCAFVKSSEIKTDDSDSTEDDEDLSFHESVPNWVIVLKDIRSCQNEKIPSCTGKLQLEIDKFGHHFIRCEYYTKGHRNHLRLRNLSEYDITYLNVLFKNDINQILLHETAATDQGYGPLCPCNVTAAAREQKQLCPLWHRYPNGVLQRGTMEFGDNCKCRFEIYEPNDLNKCPYILVVSRNPHSHTQTTRTKTPATIRRIFNLLLEPLDWRLADATPRRILLDNTFIHGLRKLLCWNEFRDPGLGELHPSFVNYDHTQRLINELRYERYPEGTGLEGARHLLKQHLLLSPEQQYLRCIKTYDYPKEGKFHIVICMFKAMSHLLLNTKRPSIDTAFKRLHNWQEFEIEAWFPEYSRSVVVARAFTTPQSATAHQILFRLIFDIVKKDTGNTVQFHHIHGSGFDTITADGHRGQALVKGLGLYCQEVCRSLTGWSMEWNKPLHALTPTEHLACFYRYCFTHFNRNITNLRGHVKEDVISAMMSLASADTLPNYNQVIATIRAGGKKASDWLKDKESNDAFTLAAVYRPLSKIALDRWKAAPRTSNGNEQAHRNINRDGTKLTMLAGIMRGLQFDSRALGSIDIWIEECIPSRDRLATHFRRAKRAIHLKTTVQQKSVLAKDIEIQNLYEKARELQESIIASATAVKRALDTLQSPERAQKRLRKCDEQLQDTNSQIKALLPQGSGSVTLTGLQTPESLYDRWLLDAKLHDSLVSNTQRVQLPPNTFAGLQTAPFIPHEHMYAAATPSYHDIPLSQSGYIGFGGASSQILNTPATNFVSAWYPAPVYSSPHYSLPVNQPHFYHPEAYYQTPFSFPMQEEEDDKHN